MGYESHKIRANVFSRLQTQRDSNRVFTQLKGSWFDSARRCRTLGTVLNFPDTEKVTGSNPVRPTSLEREFECPEQGVGAIPEWPP
jgi:hypothetical protein